MSGHGYGHASRVNAVLRQLVALQPKLQIQVRTAAPSSMFDPQFQIVPADFEPRVTESSDALSVDTWQTVVGHRALLQQSRHLVSAEVAVVRDYMADLIFADIPFLAGEIAEAAGVPCVGMGNFTWDWILEHTADDELLNAIRSGYGRFRHVFRLPLSHREGWQIFQSVDDVPLVTPRGVRTRSAVRKELGIAQNAANVVLIGGRARLQSEVVKRIRQEIPDIVLLTADALPSYSDLLRASDVVVSKLGYSLAAECIAEGVRILHPPRRGFREEAILAAEVPRSTPTLAIPYADWVSGNWGEWLLKLQSLPLPSKSVRVDGAKVVAERLLS